jgi:hypothetical protein
VRCVTHASRPPQGRTGPASSVWTWRKSAGWRDAAKAMFIPYDEALGVHPQDEGFTGARTERLQHFLRSLAGKRLGRSRPERLAQPNPGCGRNHNNARS